MNFNNDTLLFFFGFESNRMQQMESENESRKNIEQLKDSEAARNASKFHNLNEDATSGN